jgi:hypothetical protein
MDPTWRWLTVALGVLGRVVPAGGPIPRHSARPRLISGTGRGLGCRRSSRRSEKRKDPPRCREKGEAVRDSAQPGPDRPPLAHRPRPLEQDEECRLKRVVNVRRIDQHLAAGGQYARGVPADQLLEGGLVSAAPEAFNEGGVRLTPLPEGVGPLEAYGQAMEVAVCHWRHRVLGGARLSSPKRDRHHLFRVFEQRVPVARAAVGWSRSWRTSLPCVLRH